MQLIAIGRLRAGPEADLCARYAARLRPKLTITELADGHGAPAEIKRRETESLLAALPAKAFVVVLDQAGAQLSSEVLAQAYQGWMDSARPLVFLIGGAGGLAAAAMARADFVLSLGTLTWPHMLVRVLLLEQLYRLQSIVAGHPYHRAGRP